MRQVYLDRIFFDDKQVLGAWCIVGDAEVYVFKTLELAWKNNQSNISCIPPGQYQCRWTFSPHFQKYTYEVMNVPNRYGIRIHAANFNKELLGCIALGDAHKDINIDGELDVIHSGTSMQKFNDMMGGADFMLNIR